MKKYFNSIFLLAMLSLLANCSDDFLDTDENQYLTENRKNQLKKESPEAVLLLIQGSLNGIYNNNIAQNTGHDGFGLKAFQLATDLTGLDLVQVKHHWFGYDYNFDNREAPYRRTNTMWKIFYEQISSANIILQDFFGEPVESEVLKQKEAETKGLRGIAYYYLINLYQQTYKGNENEPGVPLILSTTDENMPRATVAEVYKQIIEDLTFAFENNVVTDAKTDIDKAVAAAYLAKAYAAMENWVEVEKYAKFAADAVPRDSAGDIESSKWDIGNGSWLWGFDISGETTTLYASLYSHLDNTIGGYAGGLGVYKSIYRNLYDKIGDKDVRKKLYINEDLFPEIAKKHETLPKYANIKYITPKDFTGDYCFLRGEDPFLLFIEALNENNKLDEAKTVLEAFVKTRNTEYSAENYSTKDALREEIRTQRRIELWAEGTSFFDLKRWKMGANRDVEGSNHRTKINVPVGDKKWVYQIPQKEMDANKNIGKQNP